MTCLRSCGEKEKKEVCRVKQRKCFGISLRGDKEQCVCGCFLQKKVFVILTWTGTKLQLFIECMSFTVFASLCDSTSSWLTAISAGLNHVLIMILNPHIYLPLRQHCLLFRWKAHMKHYIKSADKPVHRNFKSNQIKLQPVWQDSCCTC